MDWGIFVVLCIIWGSSFKLMKIGMEKLTPYEVASLRMMSAGIVLLPFARSAVKNIPRSKTFLVILSGLLGAFFPAFLFCLAETKIDSSLAGILNALTPLFTLLISVFFFNIRVARQKYTGVFVGFVGLSLLFLSGKNISFAYVSYSLLVLLATIFYGINVNIITRYMNHVGSLHIAAFAFSFLTIPSALILWYSGYFTHALLQPSLFKATVASAILGVFGTALASVLFYMLVKRAGGLFASTVTYGIPFVAVFWGLLSGEYINIPQVFCLGLILAGVYLANKPIKNELQTAPSA